MRAVLVVLLLAGWAVAGDDNMLKNPGFENRLDSWFWVANSGRAKIDVDAQRKAGGKRALHIEKTGGFPVDVLGQAFEIAARMRGGSFTVSAQVMGKGVGNSWFKLYIHNARGENVLDEVDVGRLRGSFKWKEIKRTFRIPADAVSGKVLFQVFLGGEIWIDEVKVAWGETGRKKRRPAKPLDKRTRKWLDENAVSVRTLDVSGPLRDLDPLKQTLKDVRVVQLGENSHGDGACFEAKCRLVRWLHEAMGFEVVVWESGLFECDRANALVKPGADAKEVMKASIFRIWHTKRTKPLLDYLIECSATRQPMLLAGFDPQQSGEMAKDFLPVLRRLLKEAGVDPGPGEITPRLLEDNTERLEKAHGARETAFWKRALENHAVGERLRKLEGSEAFNLRDEWMGKNLIWLAEERFKGKKLVVWAATRHIAHNMKSIRLKGARQYRDTKGMGEWVHEHFGRQCYA